MKELIEQAADIIMKSNLTGALTGAGISVESGIPDFRSPEGLWSIYDPSEYATITAFRADPEKVWKMFRAMDDLIVKAKPNKAHIGMGDLETMGYLHFIITQNVDNLHQAGGSKNVIEFHGNASALVCLSCGKKYDVEEKKDEQGKAEYSNSHMEKKLIRFFRCRLSIVPGRCHFNIGRNDGSFQGVDFC